MALNPPESAPNLRRHERSAQAPILLFGSYGELDLFASVDDAERAIDPWSLSEGQLSACDARTGAYCASKQMMIVV